MSKAGKPAVTLHLNLEDWDFQPPKATILSLDLRRPLAPMQVPSAIEDPSDPVEHVVGNLVTQRIWFCSPGFYEYHEFYSEDRWERIRGTEQGKITWIVERACNLIDRQKL